MEVGANATEYDRRLKLLIDIRKEWMKKFPDDVVFVEAGIDQIPINWINIRLKELSENWRVEQGDEGYLMPALPDQTSEAK